MSIKTRFAPSPTGYLHIGGARTALFSWLYARRHGGSFVLRIEDTDLERSTTESVNAILEGMTWLGLEYDEGPFYQTHRFDRYKQVIDQLLQEGKAYRCYCSKDRLEQLREQQMENKEKPKYDGFCLDRDHADTDKPYVIRFKNPKQGEVVIEDMVKGQVVISNDELDDLIIARSDGTPTYNLTVVVDDLDMGMTHVVRGDDHLNNTPRQINILKAIGAEPPVYAHVPMILGDDGKRMSKRHGATSVMQYRDEGFLPEAVLNYLVRLGWSHGDRELFTLDEMISLFDAKDINKSASTYSEEKLLWLNQEYIKAATPEHLAHHLSWQLKDLDIDPTNGPDLLSVIKPQQDRARTLKELAQNIEFFYKDFDDYNAKAAKKNLKVSTLEPMQQLTEHFMKIEDWCAAEIQMAVDAVMEQFEINMGKIGQPVRVAISGKAATPAIDITLELLGKQLTIQRMGKAIDFIKARAENQVVR